MRHVKRLCFVVPLIAVLALFTACLFSDGEDLANSVSWQFKSRAYGYEYIEVTVLEGGKPESFKLYADQSVYVRWKDKEEDFSAIFRYRAVAADGSTPPELHVRRFNNPKEILFYVSDGN